MPPEDFASSTYRVYSLILISPSTTVLRDMRAQGLLYRGYKTQLGILGPLIIRVYCTSPYG